MTRAEIILALLRDSPRTFDELVSVTGLSISIVRTTLSDLRRSGYMEPVPTTYVVTPKAAEDEKPKIDWASQRAQRGSSSSRPSRDRKGPRESISMVETSMRTNPNSVFALGAMA